MNAIINSTKENDVVTDPFLGSGSTLIACEKTSRICYGMEIEERYCDVIVNRYMAWCKSNKIEWKIKLNGKEYPANRQKTGKKVGVADGK